MSKTVRSAEFGVKDASKQEMADERTKPPYNQPSAVPAKYNWPTLLKKDGDDLFDHYRHMLESLGNETSCVDLNRFSTFRQPLAVTIQLSLFETLYGNRVRSLAGK